MNRAPTRIRPAANRRQLCREAIPTLRRVTLTDKKDSTWCCPYLEVRLINPALNADLYSALHSVLDDQEPTFSLIAANI